MSVRETNRLVRIADAAFALGRTARQVKDLIGTGVLHGVIQRRRWYLHADEIEDFLTKSRKAPSGKEML